MTKFEACLLVVVALIAGAFGGTLYGYGMLDVARVQVINECQARNQLYDAALENLTKDKWQKWNYLYDAAKKAERKQP